MGICWFSILGLFLFFNILGNSTVLPSIHFSQLPCMISVGFYGQFQGPFICSLVLLGPMQRADGYICETWLFVNWRPPGGSGFCRHSATFAHDSPLPQSSLIRTQTDRFPWFDLVLSDQEGRLGRWNNVFQRRMFNWQFMLQKSSLNLQLALLEFHSVPLLPWRDAW